jgi:hypothetical protein
VEREEVKLPGKRLSRTIVESIKSEDTALDRATTERIVCREEIRKYLDYIRELEADLGSQPPMVFFFFFFLLY